VLHFSDPSGTIASRFIPVLFKESFEGREDETLTEQLLDELPGILELGKSPGWRRLRDRRKFVLPIGSQEALQRMEKKAAPMLNFVAERCVTGGDQSWDRDDCYAVYKNFCQESQQ
jgi:putative DNA primase/helicase